MDGSSKILIVDDTVDTVELLRKRLRSEGYDTSEAYDGEECLACVGSYNPDLIILDVMMPKLNGYEVCERLKTNEDTRYIPVLMLTAKSEISDKVKGLDTGADDYLAKPFDYKELSARIRSLLKIKQSHEKLVEDEKLGALEQMMDEVAHEVRNPLVSIGGYARRVHDNLPEGSPNRKYMEMIMEDVAKLEKMIKQMIEIQMMSLSYVEPTNVNNVIMQALTIFERELEEKAIDVETELRNDLPLIQADPMQLTQAIANLIQNAIEAMTAETRVLRLSSSVIEGCIEIRVADTGKGISREKTKHIFEPLFTSKIYGPGLGLTYTLKVIQEHRGTISIESDPGKGSTFTVRLPLKKH
ncbi:MAG TPA: response regulator [Candidatus Sulfobium mesophilum]|nr:response regulator [Candidatus Sulfobium mesophilum]